MVPQFSDSGLGGLMAIAELLLPQVISIGQRDFSTHDADWSDRACAVFGIFRMDGALEPDLHQERQALIGRRGDKTTNYARRVAYLRYCIEKAQRLHRNAFALNHLTSYLSRDPDLDQWGGAVVFTFPGFFERYIFSCSGLPEKADEAFCLLVALLSPYASPELENYAKLIANNSDNEYWLPFYNQVNLMGSHNLAAAR